MLAYQQQHRQGSGVASSTNGGPNTMSAVPPASANAATSKLRFGNTGLASWAMGSGGSSHHAKHHRLHDNHGLRRSQEDSRGSRRFKPAFNAAHWHKHGRHDAPAVDNSNVHPLRRAPNAGDINKQWRASPAPAAGLQVINPVIRTPAARDPAPVMSSTYQGKDATLLSGLSLALNKNQAAQPSMPTTPLYEVPQQRTPRVLSPSESMKTPGYVDPESLPFELGSTISDPKTGYQYQLLSVLGEGSYAVVYLARSSHDGAKYALKCLSKLGLTPRQLSLQRTELDIHSSVCPHPHIVTLYSHFETRDWLFLVMERVAGPDLYEYITQHPAFNANQEERRFVEATRLFEQMIDAVAHIHALKAYHRDLKPENFILGADGNLKLTDFGLATRESLSEDFECGSKPYMSYENRNGGLNPNDPTLYGPREDYSPRLSDVWALGVLFLNLLFAQSPWADASRDSCFKFCRFLREGAAFLTNQFPKLPREVADFLVTRVFSPESGRCNVLELKQWVQDLGYPFSPLKVSTATAAPRPIALRHKNGTVGRKAFGNPAPAFSHTAGSLSKKWSPASGVMGAFKVPAQSAAASTALVLDSVVATSGSKPKSPITWRAPQPAAATNKLGSALPETKPNNLSTSVPALVFSQIIPATQAAAARKMMPRELNPTAAKAAAAILQSSMLCLPKNGVGQGKQDSGIGHDGADHGSSSWSQLENLSEAEEEDAAGAADDDGDDDDSRQLHAEYSAAATDMASRFPMQSIAGSLGCSLSKSFVLESEDDMDFSQPLSFEDTRKSPQFAAVGAKSLPNGGISAVTKKPSVPYADDLDAIGRFSDEDESAATTSNAPQAAASASRVRFSGIPPAPPAVVPLSRGGRNGSATNSTDSSLTATLVSPSVEYYSPHMAAQVRPAPTSTASTAVGRGNNSDGIEADDEAEGSTSRRPPNARKTNSAQTQPRSVRFNSRAGHASDGTPNPIAMHSMPAPFKTFGAYSLAADVGNTTFSWADDVEELPIPSLASRMGSAADSRQSDENSDDDALSDAMSWSGSDHYRVGHGDGLFDMEL
ncbi:hypothetical protein LPJ70_001057 [Coemansia sp. RSA 2708]|nr:hypothetical protein LPJ70_001057 [Coemansia sp. RSA 2708]